MHALISVSDKAGVVELARALAALGVRLLVDRRHRQAARRRRPRGDRGRAHTGFPEMLDGRVKTLHPKIHGGLLARRDDVGTWRRSRSTASRRSTCLVVNLYPFEATVARAGCTLADAIENIDIGGPAMVRSAAKNWKPRRRPHRRVAVRRRRRRAEAAWRGLGSDRASRSRRGVRPHRAVRRRDQRLPVVARRPSDGVPERHEFPAQANGRFVKLQDLRYGENPHQRAAFYRDLAPAPVRSSRPSSCRARSSRTTTSPMPTRRGSASRASPRRRA
jgi:phosphoribosylaminoimidazolecarboxamide formyltransferase/IMP cyclohydrolase